VTEQLLLGDVDVVGVLAVVGLLVALPPPQAVHSNKLNKAVSWCDLNGSRTNGTLDIHHLNKRNDRHKLKWIIVSLNRVLLC
jgi:hypothetical protein